MEKLTAIHKNKRTYHFVIQKEVFTGPEKGMNPLPSYRKCYDMPDLVETNFETRSDQNRPPWAVKIVSIKQVEVCRYCEES